MDAFDCTSCYFDNNTPEQISNIWIDRIPSASNSCLNQRIRARYETCSTASYDLKNYVFNFGPNQDVQMYPSPPPIDNVAFYFSLVGSLLCNSVYSNPNPYKICSTPTNTTITFSKTNVISNGIASNGSPLGQIYMTFNDVNDYLHYKNNIINQENFLLNDTGPIITNPADPKYYRGYILQVPLSPTPNNLCGDPNTEQTYYIHRTAYPSIIYVEDPGNSFWSITIPMPEVMEGLPISGCTNCYSNTYYGPFGILSSFNSSSFADPLNTLTQTNNFGSKYTQPWGKEEWLELNDSYCYKRIYINAGYKYNGLTSTDIITQQF